MDLNAKKVRDAKRVIKQTREDQAKLRADESLNPSTALRHVYQRGHDALAVVEGILSAR